MHSIVLESFFKILKVCTDIAKYLSDLKSSIYLRRVKREKRKLDRVSFKQVHKDLRKIEHLSIPLFDLIPELIPIFNSLFRFTKIYSYNTFINSRNIIEINDFKLSFN